MKMKVCLWVVCLFVCFPSELVACWPKKLQNKIRTDSFYPQFTNCCLPSNIAKTSGLGIDLRNYVSSLPIKKFQSTEFGSKRSDTILYSCHAKFYFCAAVYLIFFLFLFVFNQCINPDYIMKGRKTKKRNDKIPLNHVQLKIHKTKKAHPSALGVSNDVIKSLLKM